MIKDSKHTNSIIMAHKTLFTFCIVAFLSTSSSSGLSQGNTTLAGSTTILPTTLTTTASNSSNTSTEISTEASSIKTTITTRSASENETTIDSDNSTAATTTVVETSTSGIKEDSNETLAESLYTTISAHNLNGTDDDTTESSMETTTFIANNDSLSDSTSDDGITTVSEQNVTSTPLTSKEVHDKLEDLQYQIYIICGTFGIISLLLIILVIALVASISRLRDQVISTRHVPYIPDNRAGDQIHAYDNSAFSSSGHEMQERRRSNLDKEATKQSYGIQNGNNPYERQNEAESSQNTKSTSGGDRDSKSTLMRYEDGVIPFHNDSTPNGSMRRSHS